MVNIFFKCLHIQRLDLPRQAKIWKHLQKNFNQNEPTLRSLLNSPNFSDKNYLDAISGKYTEAVEDNLSLVAEAPNGDIAGLLINGWIHKGEVFNENRRTHPHSRAIEKLFYDERVKMDFFKKFKVNKIVGIKAIAVAEQYQMLGLGKKLIEEGEQCAKDAGAKVLVSDCNSAFSRAMHQKLNWNLASEVYYKDFLDEKGDPTVISESQHIKYQLRFKVL